MFEPLAKRTIVDEIIQIFLEMVKCGELRPGDKLPSERELAARLKVSRASVREAMKALSFTGVISIKPGDGTYLNQVLSVQESISLDLDPSLLRWKSNYDQIIEARRILETQLIRLAASRATPEAIDELDRSLERMEEDIAAMNIDAFVQEDLSFHQILAQASQNNILHQALNAVWNAMENMMMETATVPNRYMGSFEQHKALVQLVKNGDTDGAEEMMNRHMDYLAENLRLYMETIKKGKDEAAV